MVELGHLLATPAALSALEAAEEIAITYLRRHKAGDWGDVCAEDRRANDRSAKDGSRLLSAYVLPKTREKIWIITEADRSSTLVLLPSDY